MSTWDDKPNDYEHAVELLKSARNRAIEECARAIETCRLQYEEDNYAWEILAGAADAIRALKDK